MIETSLQATPHASCRTLAIRTTSGAKTLPPPAHGEESHPRPCIDPILQTLAVVHHRIAAHRVREVDVLADDAGREPSVRVLLDDILASTAVLNSIAELDLDALDPGPQSDEELRFTDDEPPSSESVRDLVTMARIDLLARAATFPRDTAETDAHAFLEISEATREAALAGLAVVEHALARLVGRSSELDANGQADRDSRHARVFAELAAACSLDLEQAYEPAERLRRIGNRMARVAGRDDFFDLRAEARVALCDLRARIQRALSAQEGNLALEHLLSDIHTAMQLLSSRGA